jgi:cell wall-associated NlpC family hydrolase
MVGSVLVELINDRESVGVLRSSRRLVMMAYRAAGVSLPRTTFQQVYAGTAVYSFSDLMPGDLLFTPGSDGTAENPGHVGMYVGQGLVIQAPQTGEDIEITPFKGYWQQNVVAVRRVV